MQGWSAVTAEKDADASSLGVSLEPPAHGGVSGGAAASEVQTHPDARALNGFFIGCVDDAGPWSVSASGALEPLDGHSYDPEGLIDDDLTTCWAVEGGVGSWFSVLGPEFGSDGTALHGFSILNGYTKSPERWQQNARVKTLEISIGSLSLGRVDLLDTPSVQTVDFQDLRLKESQEVRFTVLSVYPGSTFNHLCVTEVSVERRSLRLVSIRSAVSLGGVGRTTP